MTQENSSMEQFDNLQESSSYISKKYLEIKRKYSGKYIGVIGNDIVAIADSFPEIMDKIKDKKLNPSIVLINYIPHEKEIILY